jgi:hypothetical protein
MFGLNWILGLVPSWLPWAIIITGIALFFVGIFLPVFYKLPIRILSIILICGGFYIEGRQDVIKNDEYKIKQVVVEQQTITETIVKKYKEKRDKVKKTNEKIIETISTKDDHMCVLPQSFVILHNSAAKNTVPDTTTRIDGTASGIELSAAEKTIIINYGLYHQLVEQLKALQEWVKQQKELNP